MTDRDKLIDDTGKDLHRLLQKERRPATWAGMLFYGGTLGLLFVVPIVGGAYLGRWVDGLMPGYSVRWTVSFIVLGLVVGGYYALRFIRERT